MRVKKKLIEMNDVYEEYRIENPTVGVPTGSKDGNKKFNSIWFNKLWSNFVLASLYIGKDFIYLL